MDLRARLVWLAPLLLLAAAPRAGAETIALDALGDTHIQDDGAGRLRRGRGRGDRGDHASSRR